MQDRTEANANVLNHVYEQLRRPRCHTLFPYTTLFRSRDTGRTGDESDPQLRLGAGREGGGLRPAACAGEGEGASEPARSEEHTSELQSLDHLVCRLLLEKKNAIYQTSGLLGWTLQALF